MPYFQWTAKGDTAVNRRLTPSEDALYSEWIGNDRQVRALIAEMREVAAKAHQILLEAVSNEAS